MKPGKLFCLNALATVLVLPAAPSVDASQFEDNGLYLGGSYGLVRVEDSDFEDENTFPRFFGGFQILPFLGIEAAYYDFGEYGGEFANAETTATSLAVTGRLPLTPTFALFADIGPLWWETDVNAGSFRDSFDGSDVRFAAGASFEVAENVDVRATYAWVDVDLSAEDLSTADPRDFDSDLNMLSVGVKLQF